MMEKITLDEISTFLLTNKYLLTALELDFELIERGMESKTLRNFFSNPENFEHVTSQIELPTQRLKSSPSVSTIDSLDFAKYSDDGTQQYDERIKVLEFELRKKNEEVRKLREELTQMSTLDRNPSFVIDWNVDSDSTGNSTDNSTGPLMAHENRALNFLINEHLLQEGFKLTAVSLSEEVVDQDLDSWDDVGLNIPKLPSLRHLFSKKCSAILVDVRKYTGDTHLRNEDQEIQTDLSDYGHLLDDYKEVNSQLHETIERISQDLLFLRSQKDKDEDCIKQLNQQIVQLKKEVNDAKSKLICVQRDLIQETTKKKVSSAVNCSTSGDTDLKSESISIVSDAVDDSVNSDQYNKNRENEIHSKDESVQKSEIEENYLNQNLFDEIITQRNVTKEFITILSLISEQDNSCDDIKPLVENLDQMVALITDMIPRLFSCLGDKHNKDIMLLLVQCACLHVDSKERERLLKFLMNLYDDPTDYQIIFILKQIQRLCGYLGTFRIEAELITQIWEMLYEKPRLNSNKRILLAKTCGIVCPYAPANLRSSLILSIHQQMLEEENDPRVIPHILASVAFTVPHLEDVDKIHYLIQIVSKYLWNSDSNDSKKQDLTSESSYYFITISKLLPAVAQWCLDANILHSSLIENIFISMERFYMTINNIDYVAVCNHLIVLNYLVPFIEIWIKSTTPTTFDDSNTVSSTYLIDESLSLRSNGNKENGLYQLNLITSKEKYESIQQNFMRYTGMKVSDDLQVCDETSNRKPTTDAIQCWSEIKWVQSKIINRMINLLSNIQPKSMSLNLLDQKVISDLAKNQFSAVPLKSKELCCRIGSFLFEICSRLTVPIVSECILPCFTSRLYNSTNKGVECDLRNEAVITGLISGYCGVLSALATMDNSPSRLESLKKFVTNIFFLVAAEHLSVDGIKLLVATINCCFTKSKALADIFIPSMQPCIACLEVSVRVLMCLVLHEIVLQLSDEPIVDDVTQTYLLNTFYTLLECPYESVKTMIIGPLVLLLQMSAVSNVTKQKIFTILSDLMNESVDFKQDPNESLNQLQQSCSEIYITTMIQMINVIGPGSSSSFKDEIILPWLMGITEINNATPDTSRRSAIAMILYSTFSTLNYYLETGSAVESYLLPSLDRLRLDMMELYPENVKEVDVMSQEIRKRIDSKQKSYSFDADHTVKSKLSGLSFMNRSNVSSSASSLFGKLKELRDINNQSKVDDGLDSNTSTKSNITNFFAKRR